jgi:hypothetical protein
MHCGIAGFGESWPACEVVKTDNSRLDNHLKGTSRIMSGNDSSGMMQRKQPTFTGGAKWNCTLESICIQTTCVPG